MGFYWFQIEYNLYGLYKQDALIKTFKSYESLYEYCISNNTDAKQR